MSEPAAQLDVGQALLALSQQMHGAKPSRIGSLVPCKTVPAISDV